MSITIPDEIYGELVEASRESLRPLATEAVYRIKVGLGNLGQGSLAEKGTIPEIKREEVKSDEVDKLVKKGLVSKGVKDVEFKSYFKK